MRKRHEYMNKSITAAAGSNIAGTPSGRIGYFCRCRRSPLRRPNCTKRRMLMPSSLKTVGCNVSGQPWYSNPAKAFDHNDTRRVRVTGDRGAR